MPPSPRYAKPGACADCTLEKTGFGFSPPSGPQKSPLLFVGEALGFQEALAGFPFAGAAGSMFERSLRRVGLVRDQVRVANCVSCFPGDTIIQAPNLHRGFRRRYVGAMCTATTRDGILTGTPNHPVLTATGWKPLGELQYGDYLIRPCVDQGHTGRYPDVQYVPAPIAKIFQSLADRWGRTGMVGSGVDFHGDGSDREVEVVPSYGKLIQSIDVPVLEHLLEQILEPSDFKAGALTPQGQALAATLLGLFGASAPAPRGMRPIGDFSAVLARRTKEAEALGLRVTPLRDVEERERGVDPPVAEVQAALDLFCTLASQVQLSEVIGVTLSQFDGHVYNLETGSHKYIANGFIVHNCQPPGDWLDGAPWEHSALAHCKQYLDPVLEEDHQVIVTLGAIPLKQVLDLWGMEGVRVQDFHGTVHRLPSGRMVVPTYHSSHLQRGAVNLLDVVRFDFLRALAVARGTWAPAGVSLLLDPSPTAFALWASAHLERVRQDPHGVWLAADIETPDKEGGRDEGELTSEDVSTQIQRINFSDNPDEGLSVPYDGPYIPIVDALLKGAGIVLMWNKGYDEPRLRLAGHATLGQEIWDLMWAAHHLQSDLPLGLGFWTPFYSPGVTWNGQLITAWKHLGKQKGQEALHGSLDGLNTTRVGHGIVKDLVESDLWTAFYRHTHLREQYVLRPAHDIGLLVDVPRLDTFHRDLQAHAAAKLQRIGEYQLRGNLKPKGGYAKKPAGPPPKVVVGDYEEKGDHAKAEYIAQGIQLVELDVEIPVRCCRTCSTEDVGPAHNCLRPKRRKGQKGSGVPEGVDGDSGNTLEAESPTADLELRTLLRHRWFWQLPFNPDATQQILAFIRESGEAPGKAKKTRKDTANKETLRRLAKKTGNPVYTDILDYKAIKKVDSTYALGAKRRIWADGRLHPVWTGRPSTFRDSYVNPNIQNVVTDRGGPQSLAAGFRQCLVASPGCQLLEVDYSGIESVETGWLCGDPDYIRLAYLGVHAYLASHLLDRPASLSWSDDDLKMYFAEIKKTEEEIYDKAKRCVHGNNYGLTIHGMVENFPEVYADLTEAQKVQDLYYAIAPKLPAFHERMRDQAYTLGRLGGPPIDDYYTLTHSGQHHPYAYRHWFWGVQAFRPQSEADYRKAVYWARKRGTLQANGVPKGYLLINQRPFKVVLGEDSKRVIAFFPQSIAAGRLKEAQLDLFHPDSVDFIGDRYYGKTPLRAPIHDSLLLEVPDREMDYVLEQVVTVMRRPEPRQPCPPEWGIGSHLAVGVAAKVGKDWMHMEKVKLPEMQPETIEPMFLPVDDQEYEDDQDLGTRMVM